MKDIPWDQTSFEGHKLEHLSLQGGFFFNGHRAVNNYQAVIVFLSYAGFPESRSTLSLLPGTCQNSMEASVDQIHALRTQGHSQGPWVPLERRFR